MPHWNSARHRPEKKTSSTDLVDKYKLSFLKEQICNASAIYTKMDEEFLRPRKHKEIYIQDMVPVVTSESIGFWVLREFE